MVGGKQASPRLSLTSSLESSHEFGAGAGSARRHHERVLALVPAQHAEHHPSHLGHGRYRGDVLAGELCHAAGCGHHVSLPSIVSIFGTSFGVQFEPWPCTAHRCARYSFPILQITCCSFFQLDRILQISWDWVNVRKEKYPTLGKRGHPVVYTRPCSARGLCTTILRCVL